MIKKRVLNWCMNTIKKNKTYDESKLAEIKYGLEGLYLTISKFIIISILALILDIFIELLIFSIIYNIIRMPSFGLHATKSWICLVSSTIVFIGVPYLCKIMELSNIIISIIGIITLILIYKNAPADTEKRPIINPKRRLVYKTISVSICILFIILTYMIKDNFLSNCFISALIIQCFMISPTVYKIFNLKYDNYKQYLQTSV